MRIDLESPVVAWDLPAWEGKTMNVLLVVWVGKWSDSRWGKADRLDRDNRRRFHCAQVGSQKRKLHEHYLPGFLRCAFFLKFAAI